MDSVGSVDAILAQRGFPVKGNRVFKGRGLRKRVAFELFVQMPWQPNAVGFNLQRK